MRGLVIAQSIICVLLIGITAVLFLKVTRLEKSAEPKPAESKVGVTDEAITRELAAQEMYETAGKTYIQAVYLVDNILKTETAAKDKLVPESFESAFSQSYEGFNKGIRMAESILKDYPDTYYGRKLDNQGLSLETGNVFQIPALRQNRDVVLNKFTEGRGSALANLIRSECRMIDNAIVQSVIAQKVPVNTQIEWKNIQSYLRPDSRVADSGGNDILGNPFALGVVTVDRASVKISDKTFEFFKDTSFDWGQFAPTPKP